MIDFTLVIPVYNTSPSHLYECINSITNQTYKKHFPIMIVDDGSTHIPTLRALKLLSQQGFEVVTLNENKGTSAALNKAHELVETPYIALCGSQDIFDRNKIQLQTDYLKKNQHVSVLSTNLFSFHNDDIFRKPLFISEHKLTPTLMDNKDKPYWLANHGTVIYKNDHVKSAGLYNEDLRREQDIDLWKRMYFKGMFFHCLPNILYAWRKFDENN